MCPAWSSASSRTAASPMSGRWAAARSNPLRDRHARQPVPHRLDVQGVHRARHPEAARRGPAVSSTRSPRPMCPEMRSWRYPTGDSPRIRVRDLLSHAGGFVTDDPWGDRQQVLTEAEFTAMLRRGRALHPRARHRLRIFQFRLCPARPDRHQRLGPPLQGLYRARDHAPARHGLDRLRHLRLAAGAARARLSLGE